MQTLFCEIWIMILMFILVIFLRMAKVVLIINLLISLLFVQQTLQLEAFITQYIVPFDLPMDDLKAVTMNQLSRNQFKTNTFTTDNVTVSRLKFQSVYNGTGKIVDPKQQSIFHTVWNDSIDVTVTYQADIHKIPTTKKTFNGTTILKIYFNYTKKIIPEDETTAIIGLDVVVDKNFQMTFTGNPSENQKKKLEQINNGVVSGKKNTTILYLLQTQQFTKQIILAFFKENLVNQKISPTYQSTYKYQFNNLTLDFDMATSGIKTIPHGIAHQMKAKIQDYNPNEKGLSLIAPYEEGFHTLFSLDFLNYFMTYNTQKNVDWINFKANRNIFQLRFFKFRVADLEFLFPKLIKKYADYYLNDILITCSPKNFDNWILDEGQSDLKVSVAWKCKGYINGVTPTPLILDFEASINYLAEITLNGNMLAIYVTKTELTDLTFKPIEDEVVQESFYANVYANQVVDRLVGYKVGTNFRIKSNSSKIMMKENIGIYVG